MPRPGSLVPFAGPVALACPRCGARLITKTSHRPPRLVCARCQLLLPQPAPLPPWLWLKRHLLRALLLLVLLLLPLIVLTLSPWMEQAPQRPERLGRLTTGRAQLLRQRHRSAAEVEAAQRTRRSHSR